MNIKKTDPSQHGRAPRLRHICIALAVVSLAGCVSRATPEAANAGERLQGQGFSITAPAGGGWTTGSSKPAEIVFHKHPGKAAQRPDVTPHVLSAGALAITDDALGKSSKDDFADAARKYLAKRLTTPGRDNISLDVASAQLHDARCAAYYAVQIDHYVADKLVPDKVEDRNEYAERGLVCTHPDSPALQVQVFYTEQFLHDSPPAQRVSADEAHAFFNQLQWTKLP